MVRSAFPPVKYDAFRLTGGLDLITPTLELPPGVVRDAMNFECSVTGGYSRINGYQRYNGSAWPSNAQYASMTMSSTTGLAVGSAIADITSGATATVCYVSGLNVVYTLSSGRFNAGDTIKVGSTTIGTVAAFNTTPTDPFSLATFQAAASAMYTTLITPVPGSGPVRGVVWYNSVLYAWRNNVQGTAMAIYKASSTGWQLVPLGYKLSFTAGAATQPGEGATVTGATSGATGTISRVVPVTGTGWTGIGGYFMLSATTGTFSSGEALKVAGVTVATSSGAAAAVTLAPGGRVQTHVDSITGYAPRVYGCDNVNPGFEFDGTVYVPITTGMVPDTPTNVTMSKNYLFFSFANSVQNSGVGSPYLWSVVFGANEITLPENVTNLQPLPGSFAGGALCIYTLGNTYILYGSSVSTWNLVPYNQGIGAAAYTSQNMDDAYALADRGVIRLKTTLNYGNFDCATLTLPIRPFMQARKTLATASALNREKSQYRVFYSDGSALYLTVINGEVKGSMPVQFTDPVYCWCDGPLVNGPEVSFYGGMTGYVYQLDIGPSFDGGAINAWFTLNYNAESASRVLKRYRRASLEVTGNAYATFQFGYSLGFGATSIDQAAPAAYTAPFPKVNWDNFLWDNFTWDAGTLLPSEVECNGTGENIAISITSNSNINQSFTVNSIVLHYTPRRGIR